MGLQFLFLQIHCGCAGLIAFTNAVIGNNALWFDHFVYFMFCCFFRRGKGNIESYSCQSIFNSDFSFFLWVFVSFPKPDFKCFISFPPFSSGTETCTGRDHSRAHCINSRIQYKIILKTVADLSLLVKSRPPIRASL